MTDNDSLLTALATSGGGLFRAATGNGLSSSTAPIISNLFPSGAKLTSTGEVILWGYLCDPMRRSPVRKHGLLHGAVLEALTRWLRL